MLRDKKTLILLKIEDFFTSSGKSTRTILNSLCSLKLSDKQFGLQKM